MNVRFASQTPSSTSTPNSTSNAEQEKYIVDPDPSADALAKKHEPIAFLGSKADFPKSHYQHTHDEGSLRRAYIISGSLAVFMIYFCILREENDIDAKLGRSLLETMRDVEVSKLNEEYRRKIGNNESVDTIKDRLRELGHPVWCGYLSSYIIFRFKLQNVLIHKEWIKIIWIEKFSCIKYLYV